ncbi:glycosyltransferase [Mycolicibacterium sp.]|uniref:glycosyltransferase n=1 Tax=Mycolicibacterium sp. TaxID=2320850 RepID=UPI003D10A4D9
MFAKAVFLSRFVPWPSDTGALLYTALLCRLVAEISDETVLVAAENPFGDQAAARGITIAAERVAWPAGKASALRYLLSGLPFSAHPFDKPELRQLARDALVGADLVLLDHIGAAWALDVALSAAKKGARLVYIAHNVEADTRRTAISAGGLRGLFARFDARRIEVTERRLLRESDLVVCVSSEDRDRFRELGAEADLVVVNPIHSGDSHFVQLDEQTPHRVVLVGSFHWRAKQQNLLRFLETRCTVAAASTIAVRVVGSMPEPFLHTLSARFPDVEVTGRVERVEDHLQGCRIGVIPEEEGGGFKLKALDYAYAGLPIFGLNQGVRGLPLQDRESMRAFETMTELWQGIIAHIDDLTGLDALRHKALAAFESNADIGHLRETLAHMLTADS